MKGSTVLAGLGLAVVAQSAATSPPISARITANWQVPELATLYLSVFPPGLRSP